MGWGASEEGLLGSVGWGHHSTQASISLEALLESWARPCKAMSARHPGSVPTYPRQGGRNGWQFLRNRTSCLIFSSRRAGGPQMAFRGSRVRVLKSCHSDPDLPPAGSDPGHGIDLSEPLPPHLSGGIAVVPAHRGCDIHRRWCM